MVEKMIKASDEVSSQDLPEASSPTGYVNVTEFPDPPMTKTSLEKLGASCLLVMEQIRKMEKIAQMTSCETARLYLKLFRYRQSLERHLTIGTGVLRRNRLVAAMRRSLCETLFTPYDFRAFMLKSKRGLKIARIVDITGDRIFQSSSLAWSSFYKLNNNLFDIFILLLQRAWTDAHPVSSGSEDEDSADSKNVQLCKVCKLFKQS